MDRTHDQAGPGPLGFRDILAVLWFRKWTVFAVTVLIFAAAFLYSGSQTPTYQSQAEVLVKPIASLSGRADSGANFLDMETETKVATSLGVAMLAAKTLGTTKLPSTLLSGLSVSEERTSAVLNFTYASSRRPAAQRGAQAFAQAYLDYRRQQAVDDLLASSKAIQQQLTALNDRSSALNDQINAATDPPQRQALLAQSNILSGEIALLQQNLVQLLPPDAIQVGGILQPANLPSAPSSPKTVRNEALGLMMGLGLGIAIAVLKERLEDRLRGRRDVESSAAVPVLAVIPKSRFLRNSKPRNRLAIICSPNSPESVGYRKLRTAVLATGGNPLSLMMASTEDDEGRTAAAANLAAALALAGKRVTLVSADLRKPRLHLYFRGTETKAWAGGTARHGMVPRSGASHIENTEGLSEVLSGQLDVGKALKQTEMLSLSLLTSGMPAANPTELLGSRAMTEVLTELQPLSDVIIIDAGPVLSVADALTLAPAVDAVLLVVKSGSTTRQSLEAACQQLQQVKAKVMGTVLTNFNA